MALTPIPQFNQIVQSLLHLDATNSYNGEVVNFHYRMFKHDPFPVIITTGFMSNNRVSGLNLHYLTYPVYRALLYNYAGNKAFNYFIIKNQS